MTVPDEVVQFVHDQIAASEQRVAKAIADALRTKEAKGAQISQQQGTVISVAGQDVQVQLDVDGTVVATTAAATVTAGDRVAVLVTPPAGSLVLGKIG